MNLSTHLTGPFPRSEALVTATRDLDRGRTTAEAVDELYDQTEREVVALEERLGFDLWTGGYLRWQDLFRPFAETWRGFTVGPVTRWFETNTFYRQPILYAPPERVAGALAARLPKIPHEKNPKRTQVIFPGPYTFAHLLENRSGETVEAITHRLGRLLAEEVKELRGLGYGSFQFQEPLLVVEPPSGARAESVIAAYRSLSLVSDGASSLVWTYFGDASQAGSLLSRLPVGTVGFDLVETDHDRLPKLEGRRGVGLGCLDPRTTLVEEPADVAQVVRAVQEQLNPNQIVLGPGAPLDLLPWEPATRKLHVLPAAAQILQGLGRNT
jgi:5-methyltetrahydropteroyltriglutamate--homocysteine methyltransferase